MRGWALILAMASVLTWAQASSAADLPQAPKPGSAADWGRALPLLDKAAIAMMWPDTVSAAKHLGQALPFVRAGCEKQDAYACAFLGEYHSLYASVAAAPRLAERDASARKAAQLWDARCHVAEDDCYGYDSYLEDLQKADAAAPPAERLPNLRSLRLRAGQSYSAICRTGLTDNNPDNDFVRCDAALKLLDAQAPAEARTLRELLCDKDSRDACSKLGRLTSADSAEDQRLGAACNGKDGKACLTLGARWMYRAGSPNFGVQTRGWAQKACLLSQPLGCLLAGSSLVDSKYGSPDYPAAATAFGKACRMLPAGGDRDGACRNETAILAALSKAGASPAK